MDSNHLGPPSECFAAVEKIYQILGAPQCKGWNDNFPSPFDGSQHHVTKLLVGSLFFFYLLFEDIEQLRAKVLQPPGQVLHDDCQVLRAGWTYLGQAFHHVTRQDYIGFNSHGFTR